jgi:hypothetical protein
MTNHRLGTETLDTAIGVKQMTAEPMRTNGAALDEQTKTIEAGVALHVRVRAELEDARREIGELRMILSQYTVELEALRSFNNLLESRVAGCVADRDLAVARREKLAALLAVIHTAMHEAAIEDFTRPDEREGLAP